MYGFVGAGALTAAIVEGLGDGVAEPPAVFLSPRNRAVGLELAGRFPNVRVCDSNQEVLDRAAVVVLAVRPQVGAEVVGGLVFRPDHVVVSALAGVSLARLKEWIAPATEVVRTIPLPAAARRQSLTVLYPDQPVARQLLERVGGVVVPGEESTLEAFSAATATFAAHLDYLATVADWLAAQGVKEEDATGYIAHIFGQLGQSLGRATSLTALTEEHMTPGGLNEQVLGDLRGEGMPDMVRRALDRVLGRLRG